MSFMEGHFMEYLSRPDIILWIQQIAAPVLDWFFIAVTFLGNEEFYLIAVPILYWCVDKKFAFKLGVLFLLSAYVNDLLKEIFQTQRPDPAVVRVIYPESGGGYAFPSGHSQGATVFWGTIAWQLKKAWAWVAALIIIIAVGISRLYLGVHWPIDVAGGWAIGAVILGLYFIYDTTHPLRGISPKTIPLIVLVLALAAVMFFIHPGDTAVRVIGTLTGMSIGFIIEEEYILFDPKSVWWYQIVKVIAGVAVIFLIKIVVKMLLPDVPVSHLVRYCLIGLWITAGVPLVFRGRKQ
jgi:membrane-associated phospholipid phosphatase